MISTFVSSQRLNSEITSATLPEAIQEVDQLRYLRLFYRRQECPKAEKCKQKGKIVSWFGYYLEISELRTGLFYVDNL